MSVVQIDEYNEYLKERDDVFVDGTPKLNISERSDVFLTNGEVTLSQIARLTESSVNDLIRANRVVYITDPEERKVSRELKTPIDLVKYNNHNTPLPKGVQLYVPRSTPVASQATISKSRQVDMREVGAGSFGYARNPGGWKPPDYQKTNAYIVIFHGSSRGSQQFSIPYPTNISESDSPRFNSLSIFGRSVDYQIYNGSSRTVTFTLDFHEEMYPQSSIMSDIISYIKSACYPKYQGDMIQPPFVGVHFGTGIGILGILTQCSTNWDGPLIGTDKDPFGQIRHCTMNLSITETKGPYTADQIVALGHTSGAGRWDR